MSTKAKREKRKMSAARRRAMKATDGSLPYRLPDGMSRFKKKAGRFKFDILGFKAGKGNPDADPGEWIDTRVYYAHKNVGGSDEMAICPLKTANKKCPLCEARAKEASKKDGDDELIKSLKPQKRVACQIKPDGSDELEIMDDAEFNFYKRLNADLGNCDESEGHDEYFRHTKKAGGRTIKASFADIATADFNYTGCEAVKFLPREEDIDEDVLKKVVCLDDLINSAIPSYEDLKKKLTMGEKDEDDEDEDDEDEDDTSEDEDDDEEDTDEDEDEIEFKKGDKVKGVYKKKPYKGIVKKIVNGLVHVATDDDELRVEEPKRLTLVKKAKEEEDDDEGEEDDEDESEKKGKESKKKSKKQKSSSKKASKEEDEDEDDEDEDLDVEDDDEDEDEDEEEDEKPKKKSKKKKPKDEDEEDEDDDIPFDDDEEDEEEDEDEEEEEEEEKPKKKKKK